MVWGAASILPAGSDITRIERRARAQTSSFKLKLRWLPHCDHSSMSGSPLTCRAPLISYGRCTFPVINSGPVLMVRMRVLRIGGQPGRLTCPETSARRPYDTIGAWNRGIAQDCHDALPSGRVTTARKPVRQPRANCQVVLRAIRETQGSRRRLSMVLY